MWITFPLIVSGAEKSISIIGSTERIVSPSSGGSTSKSTSLLIESSRPDTIILPMTFHCPGSSGINIRRIPESVSLNVASIGRIPLGVMISYSMKYSVFMGSISTTPSTNTISPTACVPILDSVNEATTSC